MRRVRRLLRSSFGWATLGCLLLSGWALWTGGILDGPVERAVRSSSVYAAPGVGLDPGAARRVIGNRRLVVVVLAPGADLSAVCDDIEGAAAGTIGLILSADRDGELDRYGCWMLPGGDEANFGRAYVAETTISVGVEQFADRPLEAVEIAAVNYDQLVTAGTIPDGARTISPSLPRYLLAAAAVTAVLLGATAIYLTGRRSARLAAGRQERRNAATDRRGALGAAAGVLAQQIIDLDARYDHAGTSFAAGYRRLSTDYTRLLARINAADRDGSDPDGLTTQVEALSQRARSLAEANT